NEAVDPYAKSVTVNGKYGVVIDLEKTNVTKQEQLPPLQAMTDSFYSGSCKGSLYLRYKNFDETYFLKFDNGTNLEFHANEIL
ncbi:hypothetical protein, partial [Bacillus cereus]